MYSIKIQTNQNEYDRKAFYLKLVPIIILYYYILGMITIYMYFIKRINSPTKIILKSLQHANMGEKLKAQ